MSLPETVSSSPFLLAALGLVLALLVAYQRTLGPGDDWIETVRLVLLLALNPVFAARDRPLIREKGEKDYVCSSLIGPNAIEEAVMAYGYERNIPATKKFRRVDGSREWAIGSFRYVHLDSDQQHHLYLFPGHGEYGTDCYHHREPRYDQEDPMDHTEGRQVHGDPDGHLREALEAACIPYDRRERPSFITE